MNLRQMAKAFDFPKIQKLNDNQEFLPKRNKERRRRVRGCP